MEIETVNFEQLSKAEGRVVCSYIFGNADVFNPWKNRLNIQFPIEVASDEKATIHLMQLKFIWTPLGYNSLVHPLVA